MNQQEYLQAIDEMVIPASKILTWSDTVKLQYYDQYNKANRKLLDRIYEESRTLVDLIPKIQHDDQVNKLEVFTHILGGPIMIIRDYTKLILADPFWKTEAEQSEEEREHLHYLKKINSAAEYLSSLDRDVVLRRMLDKLHDESIEE